MTVPAGELSPATHARKPPPISVPSEGAFVEASEAAFFPPPSDVTPEADGAAAAGAAAGA